MKKLVSATSIIFATMIITGCAAGIPTMFDAPGMLYAEYTVGKDAMGPIRAKTGKACATSILGLVGTGDASIGAAAANGGIKNVTSIDKEGKNIIGVFATYCTIVHGD